MMTKIDKEAGKEIERVLERAAHDAVFGSLEARSGRFDEPFTKEKRIIGMILRDAQSAYQSWANWDAINDQFADADVREAIANAGLGAIGDIQAALGRDALLRAYALSDVYDPHSRDDRLTLCRFAVVLSDTTKATMLASEQWARDLGHFGDDAANVARSNKKRIDQFCTLIVPDWSIQKASDPVFEDLRVALRPVRNRLAHALEPDAFDAPTIDQIRAFMTLTLKLATDMALAFLGNAADLQTFEQFSRKRAASFWKLAFRASVDLYPLAK